jgi:hypothetical protein
MKRLGVWDKVNLEWMFAVEKESVNETGVQQSTIGCFSSTDPSPAPRTVGAHGRQSAHAMRAALLAAAGWIA